MSRIALSFANASCAHCVRVVTRSLEKIVGVHSVEVDPGRQQALVEFDPQYVLVEEIRSAMERSGYPTKLLSGTDPAEREPVRLRRAA